MTSLVPVITLRNRTLTVKGSLKRKEGIKKKKSQQCFYPGIMHRKTQPPQSVDFDSSDLYFSQQIFIVYRALGNTLCAEEKIGTKRNVVIFDIEFFEEWLYFS